ncbi:MAG: type II toxin-antitoxin system RelE/ParE family toxin [Luteolibacter sp.]
MEIDFHRLVQQDLEQILEKYDAISEQLAEDFLAEFRIGIDKISRHPQFCHFDACGLRRCNLERFPYHFLYDLGPDSLRVWVVRHHRRHTGFGTRRFQK